MTGRPVLLIPAGAAPGALGRQIVLAWNTSRAATRALNDALPLIERAEKTTLLTINHEDYIEKHGALPVEQRVTATVIPTAHYRCLPGCAGAHVQRAHHRPPLTAASPSTSGDCLRGVPERKVIVYRTHFDVTLVEPNHRRPMSDGHNCRFW